MTTPKMATEREDKFAYMRALFADIADTYDLLNRLLSFRRDKGWRRYTALQCAPQQGNLILDVATGTGELALELARRGSKVIGIDICEKMLRRAVRKAGNRVGFVLAKAENLPFGDGIFDCVAMSFALRNVSDISQAISEMERVAKRGSRIVFLEFSQPLRKWFSMLYRFYLCRVLPLIGTLVSRKKHAYTYLPRSIVEFPSPQEIRQIMEKEGLRDVEIHFLSRGIVAVYVAVKA